MLRTNLGSRCLNTHFVLMALEKYMSHSRFHFRFVFFDNAMDRPTIVEMEMERKLFIDRYCMYVSHSQP